MRGGVRLPAMIVALGVLAGCSDPAGAARKEAAAARGKSPSPRPAASRTPGKRHAPAAMVWWQPSGTTRTARGLRVKTGAFRDGRMKVRVTDVAGHTSRLVTASATPRSLTVGGFALTGLRVRRSRTNAAYGVGFGYRHR